VTPSGDAAGPATPVLVHGSVGDSTVWRRVQDALDPRPAPAVDLPGFGAAERVRVRPGAPLDAMLGPLTDAVRFVDGPVVLAGNGTGALLCAHLALRLPDVVRAVLLVGPVGLPGGHERFGALSRSRLGAAALRVLGTTVGRDRFLRDQMADPDADPEGAEMLVDALCRARGFHHLARLNRPGTLDGLDGVRCPVTVLWGDRDGVLPVSSAAAFLARMPAHAKLEIVRGAGHALPIERPDLVAARIRSACAFPDSVEGAQPIR